MIYDAIRTYCAVFGIPYDPVWQVAEDCLYWWQQPFAGWLIDRRDWW